MSETDPIALFLDARERARAAGAPLDGLAATLATASADGAPSARMVLVKEVGPDGLFVYTSYESRKAVELLENPRAALVMHWPAIDEQFRFEGPVERAAGARSDAYFAGRPRDSQIGAWASPQSAPIASRDDLMARVEAIRARFPDPAPVPRPASWGGFRLVPRRVERWVAREARLHDRWLFEREGDGAWEIRRLAP